MTGAPSHRIRILLGAGGVGKTTMTAVLGLRAAEAGQRAAILTIDPARRLASALGLEAGGLGNEPRLVARRGMGELWAAMLDTRAMFEAVIREAVADPDRRERIIGHRLFRSLATDLSGTHEYMAVEALAALAADERFDRIIIDTPPARHAIDFLDSPQRLVRFLDHPLYRLVLAPRGPAARVGSLVARRFTTVVGSVVGGAIVGDIVDLFDAFAGLDTGFRDRAAEVDRVLTSGDTGYVLVTSGRAEACAQAAWLGDGLRHRSRPVDLLIANRLTPVFGATGDAATGSHPDPSDPLVRNLAELTRLAAAERTAVSALATRVEAAVVVEVDDQPDTPGSLDQLSRLARAFTG